MDDINILLTNELRCLGCLVCPAVPGARQRDTSRQWDSSDEPFFCDRSEVEVVDQVVDLW